MHQKGFLPASHLQVSLPSIRFSPLHNACDNHTITENSEILEQMRDGALRELAQECAEKFMVFGITPTQAAQLLLNLEKEKEEM